MGTGWTHGFVTDIKKFDDKDPTILQCMLYWSNCGLNPDNAHVMPRVREELRFFGYNQQSERLLCWLRFYDIGS